MDRGYIKLWRKIEEDPIWNDHHIFSKAEAWLDILLQAQYNKEPKENLIGMKIIITNRGDCIKSLETWARRWNWSKSKVSRVLNMFQRCDKVRLKNETVTIRISVCNYDIYQGTRNKNETQVKRKWNGSETEVEPDKKGKKEIRKEGKEEKDVKDRSDESLHSQFEKIINSYSEEDQKLKDEFLEHWTEKNPRGKKERWMMEKTFDVKKRFSKWIRNNKKWNRDGKPIYEGTEIL